MRGSTFSPADERDEIQLEKPNFHLNTDEDEQNEQNVQTQQHRSVSESEYYTSRSVRTSDGRAMSPSYETPTFSDADFDDAVQEMHS